MPTDPNIRILALDVAKRSGWCFMCFDVIEASGVIVNENPDQFYKEVSDLLDKWKPTHVIAASPSRFFNTIFQHGKLFGIIELVLFKRGLSLYLEKTKKGKLALPMDSHMKKEVLGEGVRSKEQIMFHFKETDPDIADAKMFATYLNLQLT